MIHALEVTIKIVRFTLLVLEYELHFQIIKYSIDNKRPYNLVRNHVSRLTTLCNKTLDEVDNAVSMGYNKGSFSELVDGIKKDVRFIMSNKDYWELEEEKA